MSIHKHGDLFIKISKHKGGKHYYGRNGQLVRFEHYQQGWGSSGSSPMFRLVSPAPGQCISTFTTKNVKKL